MFPFPLGDESVDRRLQIRQDDLPRLKIGLHSRVGRVHRDDSAPCVEILKDQVLPHVNLFCYGQVESPYGSGQFIKDLQEHFGEAENLVTSEIKGKEAIMDSIRDFLGRGK